MLVYRSIEEEGERVCVCEREREREREREMGTVIKVER